LKIIKVISLENNSVKFLKLYKYLSPFNQFKILVAKLLKVFCSQHKTSWILCWYWIWKQQTINV